MKKKLVSVLLVAAMTVTMVAGCGAKKSSAEGSTASADGDVTITYWGWDSNYYEPMFEAYEKEHPNVHFEPTAVEWGDMLTKVQQALASGSDLPVMFGMDNTLIENWKAMDICEDISAYGFDDSQYLESLAEKCKTDDGKVIGVQESINPAGIAYKRDLAKQYFGTDDPEELQKMFASYDDYATKGSEVYDQSNGEVHLFHSGQAVAEWLYFASDVANMDGDTITYTDKMTDVLSKLITLRDANAVDSYQSGTPEANATYSDDKHIFYPCPNWALTYYIQGNDPDGSGNWGLLRAPVDYNHGGAALGISSSATDEQKKAAYDFEVWATSGDGAVIARDQVGYITPYLDYMNDPDWVSVSDDMIAWFGGEDIGEVYYQQIAPNMASIPSTPWDNTIVSVRNDLSQQLMDDTTMTLDQAIKLGDDQIKQLVTDDSVTIK